ncbi:MAG: hypothetical protein WAU68_09210 [Vitreimonas sp.]
MRTLLAVAASCALACSASAFADPVHDALNDYALYQNDVSTLLDTDISSGRAVDAALARISRHSPSSVARGWIAYGALTAAQSPVFAQGVQRSMRDDRAQTMRMLRDDITYARRRQNGSDQAVDLILGAASADGARANVAGDRYDHYARTAPTVQLVSSVLHVNLGGSTRLTPAMLERLGIGAQDARPTRDASAFGGPRFWDSLAGRDGRSPGGRGGRERSDYASVTDHMLTLGAIIAADAAGSESRRVADLLDEPLTQDCMHMQQLQLRQCLSVSVDATERAYCLGHHALEGPGVCLSHQVR